MLDNFVSKTNVSLVAFYEDKPPQLKSLIQQLQACLANHKLTKNKFIPYQLEQVHGTIIGCEGKKTESGIVNQWFEQCRQKVKYIDLDGLVKYLQHQINLPLTIRFGGYNRDRQYIFLSRNEHPCDRSFQLQTADNIAIPVLIGWSWENDSITLAIDNLRRNFQQFNLLHKYHGTPGDIDNDFYLRLGTINHPLTLEERQAIAISIQNLMETQPPIYVSINPENLAFAQYQDLSLTPARTKIVSILDITSSKLEQMYRL